MSGIGISLGTIFNKSGKSAGKRVAPKKSAKKQSRATPQKSSPDGAPVRKTFFPRQSLRNVTYSAGSERTSPAVLPLVGKRTEQLIKMQLIYALANMIGQQRSSLNDDDFNVALDKMGMKYIASES